MSGGPRLRDGGRPGPSARSATRRLRSAAVGLGALGLVVPLAACEGLPWSGGSSPTTAPAATISPEDVAAADTTAVDPSWLCQPGSAEDPVGSRDGGTFTPQSVIAEGNDVMVSGHLEVADAGSYDGFYPEAIVVPAAAEHRGAPFEGYDTELGVEGAPVPPIVVRARVEVPGDGTPPSAATARLTLGTCDDAPLPDGQFLLRLSGGAGEDAGRDAARWGADRDVLVDVVDGELRAVPGAVSSADGELTADTSVLACRSPLEAVGDGDGLSVEVTQPAAAVSTVPAPEEVGTGVTGTVSVTAAEAGTRALLQGIVVTDATTGTVVAGARNAPSVPLQWVDAEGAVREETAWVDHETCTGSALRPGTYRAHGFGLTVDAEGATHLVLSEPWDVEVTDAVPEG